MLQALNRFAHTLCHVPKNSNLKNSVNKKQPFLSGYSLVSCTCMETSTPTFALEIVPRQLDQCIP